MLPHLQLKRSRLWHTGPLLAALLALGGCGAPSDSGTETNKQAAVKLDPTKLAADQTLVRGGGSEPETLDPHKISGTPESAILRDLMETLVIASADGGVRPGVAESWETTDNQHYFFKIREDAKWSNGDPVTAEDFVYSWQRILDPKTASKYAWYLAAGKVKNAQDITEGKQPPESLGVEAVDANTLKVSLEAPVPYFVSMLVHASTSPVHKGTVEQYGDQWTRVGNFVGNGAFRLTEWVVNERIEYVKNEHYWDADNVKLQKVRSLPIQSPNAELKRYEAGEIDFTFDVPIEHINRLRKERGDEVRSAPYIGTYYYEFNTTQPPFNDSRVRRALAYAIDREIMANKVMGRGEKPSFHLTPGIVTGFDAPPTAWSQKSQAERVAEAKELLAEAGFNEQNPLKFSVLYNTNDNHKKVAVAITAMWKQTLGHVDVTLENQEWKTYLDTRANTDFDIARAGWIGDYNEPSTMLKLLLTDGGSNYSKYSNPKYDELFAKSAKELDVNKRAQYYAQAEELLAQDMPIAPIYQYVTQHMVKRHVGGYAPDPLDNYYSKDMWIIEH
ncbi:oligopeptide ABC transporter substrate-binding protein OppA [Microbulbifer agarilyticus]|uniref:Oligopeptide ABC transporter substrate-binding protein OppA n=1 Tax=Microbulbifer agarilyticus TaxID=260552 RepID=A0A1Q2M0X6_9GAMM|nr:peptide ABC transporter substrate-binding protein [Microbulbifer agarilyticus]AQQ66353.1 oligopeptide ABC transporter substrate-binding protein OppA [Microbulbifer agarilyticus]